MFKKNTRFVKWNSFMAKQDFCWRENLDEQILLKLRGQKPERVLARHTPAFGKYTKDTGMSFWPIYGIHKLLYRDERIHLYTTDRYYVPAGHPSIILLRGSGYLVTGYM